MRTHRVWSLLPLQSLLLAAFCAPSYTHAAHAQSPPLDAAPVEITFLDVGQGDAIVIRSPSGQVAMIDAGRGSPLRQLQRMGVEALDLLVATHPHADHIGGLDDVLTARPVRFYMDNGRPHTTDTYRRLLATLERLADVTYLEAVPRTVTLGDVTLEVLALPTADWDHNDRSVGLVLRYGAFSAFLSGDSERAELDHWVALEVVPDVTLLKAPHHGAANGFTTRFLEAARPELVVVSVGADNPYGHPRPEALAAYRTVAETIVRTDLDGHVTVLGFADGAYEVVRAADSVVGAPTAGASAATPVSTSSAASSPETISYAPGSTTLQVRVVAGSPPGAATGLNGEFVTIRNVGPEALDIGHWRVCDLSTRCFRFPPGTQIESERAVVVHSGYGHADGVSFFMNNDRAVWNDDGDEAVLFDAEGRRVLRHVY